jgi:hypothetical protein
MEEYLKITNKTHDPDYVTKNFKIINNNYGSDNLKEEEKQNLNNCYKTF